MKNSCLKVSHRTGFASPCICLFQPKKSEPQTTHFLSKPNTPTLNIGGGVVTKQGVLIQKFMIWSLKASMKMSSFVCFMVKYLGKQNDKVLSLLLLNFINEYVNTVFKKNGKTIKFYLSEGSAQNTPVSSEDLLLEIHQKDLVG